MKSGLNNKSCRRSILESRGLVLVHWLTWCQPQAQCLATSSHLRRGLGYGVTICFAPVALQKTERFLWSLGCIVKPPVKNPLPSFSRASSLLFTTYSNANLQIFHISLLIFSNMWWPLDQRNTEKCITSIHQGTTCADIRHDSQEEVLWQALDKRPVIKTLAISCFL